MLCSANGVIPINSYALVTYTPDPLGLFLDRLRGELVPACEIKSHVTVLPPRPLNSPAELAWRQIHQELTRFPAFEIGLGNVEIFPGTNVIYLSVEEGRAQLEKMHEVLNTGHLQFEEPFAYHPHLTLAQTIQPEQVEEVLALARRRWKEYSESRSFVAERFTFVQNTLKNDWVDLAECPLAPAAILR